MQTECIEVRRSDTGCYEIPGAAEPEKWGDVREVRHPLDRTQGIDFSTGLGAHQGER